MASGEICCDECLKQFTLHEQRNKKYTVWHNNGRMYRAHHYCFAALFSRVRSQQYERRQR